MFALGKTQSLMVQRINDSGAILAEPGHAAGETVLLPGKQIPPGAGPGSTVSVFIYRDSEDRLIATTKTPAMELGELAVLEVAQATNIGAFLRWGLDKDLFLPFKEQKAKLRPGMRVLVALYIDKSDRLCATMNVYDWLQTDAPYQRNDRVWGTVYTIRPGIGAFVAVENRYFGLIPEQELYTRLSVGERVEARVIKVRPDGKLNLSTRKKAYAQIDEDAERVLRALREYGGELPFDDKADPERIKKELELSKNAFKRAVGHLLKQGQIELTGGTIREKRGNHENQKRHQSC
ncbi:MAG: S1-like domain-containing RNA-binding protein [Lachnospiraceae bacterium]|nr:S1-like domain-containing RNA-binding protein [Lachnospiraceae bacterium]